MGAKVNLIDAKCRISLSYAKQSKVYLCILLICAIVNVGLCGTFDFETENNSLNRLGQNVQEPSVENTVNSTNEIENKEQDFHSNLPNGQDPDPLVQERRNKIREMTVHAWENYKKYAWGKNELRPLSKIGNAGVFGSNDLGATIVDSLDTLYIMGLKEQYLEGRQWVADKFTLENKYVELSVFETNIRFVGGLLTMYAFTGDTMYKEKAKEVADKLLPAFDTPTGLPRSIVNVGSGSSRNYGWASGGSSILAEIGTLHLEFAYLSDITGNNTYRRKVLNVRDLLRNTLKLSGLYPNYISADTGAWGHEHISLGALGDSFYEYLLKVWIQSGQRDAVARQMYDDAMQAIVNNLIRTSRNGLIYTTDLKYGYIDHSMDHLACFAGGLFALGAATKQDKNSERYMEIGKGITNTCHESYIRSATHLGPEKFGFDHEIEAKSLNHHSKYYILRPEVIESYFIMWRLTHDQKYRDWAWDAVQAIERYCRSSGGFSGIHNVYLQYPQQNDAQESFFIAEVLKYLYLIFSDDSLLPLDQWVFNTEAHPLPIRRNPMYRRAPLRKNRKNATSA